MGAQRIRNLAAAGLVLSFTGLAFADRVPSVRNNGKKSNGALVDITVPYLKNGNNAFRGYSNAPKITSSPVVSDPANPGAKPVFNLIFYGSQQSFGSNSQGAEPRSK